MNILFDCITTLTVIMGAIITIKEFRSNNKIKRAEFLEKLITEFHHSKTEIARSLLDDFIYVSKANRDLTPEEQLNRSQSLSSLLRNHKIEPITTPNEIKVRESFDHLLDFFTKLSYYLKQQLINPAELSYFRYYLDKMENKPEVKAYIENYYYLDDFDLLYTSVKKPAKD